MLENGLHLIIEIKGQALDDADVKAKAAERWVGAVNASCEHGRWGYLFIEDPQKLGAAINEASEEETALASR